MILNAYFEQLVCVDRVYRFLSLEVEFDYINIEVVTQVRLGSELVSLTIFYM